MTSTRWMSSDIPKGSPDSRDAATIVPRRHLVYTDGPAPPLTEGGYLYCPYCGKEWKRGGGKEGFIIARAQPHVTGCYDILLWRAGWWLDRMSMKAEPLAQLDGSEPWHRTYLRNLRRLERAREKEGLRPSVPR